MYCRIEGDVLAVEIEDDGQGIDNVEQALEPLFTTKPELAISSMVGFNGAINADTAILAKLSLQDTASNSAEDAR